MRTLLLIISIATTNLFLASCQEVKAEKSSSFKVYGNCGMCEKTIEGSLDQAGIYSADWDKDSKILNVSFDSTKYQLQDIHLMVAKAGYDTEVERAPDKAYESLHSCCQYERPL